MQRITAVLGILVMSSSIATAQEKAVAKQFTYFQDPRDTVLTVVARQPGCPIAPEETVAVHMVGGGWGYSMSVRNVGTKPIVSCKYVAIFSTGNENETGFSARTRDEWLLPGQVSPRPDPNQNKS